VDPDFARPYTRDMPESVCPVCNGTGWKLLERDGLSAVDRCECQAVERARHSESKSNIPPLYRSASLDNFLIPKDNPTSYTALGQVMSIVRTYAREFPTGDKRGLLFVGDPGVGKTHLAVAALRLLIGRGFEGLFFDYQNLLERIKSGYDPTSGSSDREAFRSALDAEVLLLDDLGAHRVTDWVEDTVTSIITYRCNNQKALIATTNLADPDAGSTVVERSGDAGGVRYRTTLAERIGMRGRSRIFEMCRVIKMPAVEDYRLRRKA
jgi:DNA replication protein DnaC